MKCKIKEIFFGLGDRLKAEVLKSRKLFPRGPCKAIIP